MAQFLKFRTDLQMIVDFAVEYDDCVAVVADQGLVATLKINHL